MNFHIVIPTYNHWELTHSRLWELYRFEKNGISSILVVNNGSTDDGETENGLEWWSRTTTFNKYAIKTMKIPENCGFLRASNLGLKAMVSEISENDCVILLSNDVQIRGKFIQQICDIMESGQQTFVGGIILDRDTGWNNLGGKIFPYLEGWLLATRAMDWKDLNYFDSRYAPQDYEDIDLSTKALEKGYSLVPLNNVALNHLGAQTYGYNPEREANTFLNKKKFEEKWKGNI